MTLLKKNPQSSSKSQISENSNPNLSISMNSSIQKSNHSSSPVIKSVKSKKSTPRGLKQILSPYNKIQEQRKFLVAKKIPKSGLNSISNSNSNDLCNYKDKKMVVNDIKKSPFADNQISQDGFFQNPSSIGNVLRKDPVNLINGFNETDDGSPSMEIQSNGSISKTPIEQSNGSISKMPFEPESEGFELSSEMGSSKVKRRRDKLLEEARNSVPEPGFGRVRHLVKAFERLLSIQSKKGLKEKKDEENEERKKRMKWALPGLQSPPKVNETVDSLSSNPFSPKVNETVDSLSSNPFSPSEPPPPLFTSDNFGLDSRVSSSSDSSTTQGSFTTSRASGGSRRSRRSSSDSSGSFGGRRWKKKQQLKVTSQKPFKLRTEQRGRFKEQDFVHKMQQMIKEEETRRNHVARSLPWTTDQPEFLVKPPVKECTKPINLKLHSDIRAMERAEFDHYVAEKLSLLDQYKLELEKQHKLEEEEELKRLRKELVPRAQPMPFFDRPFIPKRSLKQPTIPREPKFHIPQHRRIKWSDIDIYRHQH